MYAYAQVCGRHDASSNRTLYSAKANRTNYFGGDLNVSQKQMYIFAFCYVIYWQFVKHFSQRNLERFIKFRTENISAFPQVSISYQVDVFLRFGDNAPSILFPIRKS